MKTRSSLWKTNGLGVLGVFALFFLASPAFCEDLPPLPQGPLLLTGATSEQQSADYWIQRIPDPNRLLKNAGQLKKFNEEIHAMVPERVDVFKLKDSISGPEVKDLILTAYGALRTRGLFDTKDQVISREFFEENIRPRLNDGAIADQVKIRWGAAVAATSVRALPTFQKMLEKAGDIEFDQLQFSLIKLWTPVAIYHESTDGAWYYVQSPYVRGWVPSKDIAVFENRKKLKEYADSEDFLVTTGESMAIFRDPERTESQMRVTMGTRIPLAQENEESYTVWMPDRGSQGLVNLSRRTVSKKSDVRKGFLPYTQANVIRQAFKLLGVRYGWGGAYGGRDCSGFIHDVFLSVGIDMPRDSRQQGYIGTQLGNFDPFMDEDLKKRALRAAKPGATLLRKPLHIMLYLGEVDGRFFIIHSTWAERTSLVSDAKNRINQVVVSDLSLNGKSYTGSLFDRLASINEVY